MLLGQAPFVSYIQLGSCSHAAMLDSQRCMRRVMQRGRRIGFANPAPKVAGWSCPVGSRKQNKVHYLDAVALGAIKVRV
jgi:hypothetical protein